MGDQLSLGDVTVGSPVRPGDPYTSRLAATEQTPDRVTPIHAAVLLEFFHQGARTDDRLIEAMGGSPSSVRTRRHELVEAGFITDVGEGTSQMGRPALLWDLTVEGHEYVEANRLDLIRASTRRKGRG